MTAEELGQSWRSENTSFLPSRRAVLALCLFNIGSMALVFLYQIGLLKRIPEPPGFDSEKVNGSSMAYNIMSTPDGLLALASYTGTALLAAAGPPNRSQKMPWLPLALGAKAAADAVLALTLLVVQPVKFKTFSFWSLLSALAAGVAACMALPEAQAALQEIKGNS